MNDQLGETWNLKVFKVISLGKTSAEAIYRLIFALTKGCSYVNLQERE